MGKQGKTLKNTRKQGQSGENIETNTKNEGESRKKIEKHEKIGRIKEKQKNMGKQGKT